MELVCCLCVIGGGKSYTAQKYVDKGYVLINFADALKELAAKLLNIPEFTEDYKAADWWCETDEDAGYFDGREFLQRLGQGLREIQPDFWIKMWKAKVIAALSEGKSVVCADMRYPNEGLASFWLVGTDGKPLEYDHTYIVCDYKSKRYDATNTHSSEEMAQALLKLDFKDGSIINYSLFQGLMTRISEDGYSWI